MIMSIERTVRENSVDYISTEGRIIQNANTPPVMIRQEADLELPIMEAYNPGTIAFIAGWNSSWQKNAAGSWIPI